jgi:lysophospholipase L1-like esterase
MRRGGRIALVVVTLVLTLLLAELALVLVGDDSQETGELRPGRTLLHRASPVPGLAYEMAPNYEGRRKRIPFRTNSYGMRDEEPRPVEDTRVRRIVVLGDSYTSGYGLSSEDSYPNVLEKLLNRDSTDPPFEVLNLGVSGYTTRDEAAVLRHRAMVWDPEFVVVGYVLNDPDIDGTQPLQRHFAATAWWQRSRLLGLLHGFLQNRRLQRLGGGNYFRYLHAPGGEPWQSVERAFDDMRETVGARGVPLLVVVFPMNLGASWAEDPFADIRARVVEAARARGFDAIDLRESFRRHPPGALRLGPRDHHPTALGHVLAAEAIHEWILTASR